ncbi:permease for cytosine/purines, uracil, thiamine, allantoin-domain-containing protein [Suillus lakei]|nr:permease for cytosine/purines, uracil, thiamine, allantoin-domain-containing protein [Suillus lakei]
MSVEQGELRKDRGARLLACRRHSGHIHEDSLEAVYQAKARILNDALQKIGMGKYPLDLAGCRCNWLDIETPVANEFNVLGPWLKLAKNIGLLVGAAFWGVLSDIGAGGMTGLFAIAAGGSMNYVALCSLTAVWSVRVCGNVPVDSAVFLVSFIIFWVVCLPLLLLKPESNSRCIFLWAIVKQGNGGHFSRILRVRKPSRFLASWVMRCINSRSGAGLAVSPGRSSVWTDIQHTCVFSDPTFSGLSQTSRARGFYLSEPLLWQFNATKLLSHVPRFAVFVFFSSQLSVTVVACGVVGGMHLAALCPRYINIRRGSLIIAVIGICINPWKIMNTANSFTSVISGYAVFLGPLTGIMFIITS